MGHQSLIDYIVRRFQQPGLLPLETHRLVAGLPVLRIITTNWDNLQEEALHMQSKPLVKVVEDHELAFFDSGKVLLVKLHGSVERPNSIVVTGDDYYDVFDRLPESSNLLRTLLATQTLLFLGFALADQDFRLLHHQVVRAMGRHKRRAYAIQRRPSRATREYWLDKNVQVIAADVSDFLRAVHDQLALAP